MTYVYDDYDAMTCGRCKETHLQTPWFDFYLTDLWKGKGRVCQRCFNSLVRTHMATLKS